MARLDLRDIQGGILRGYGHPYAVHRFLALPDEDRGRAFLRETVDEITDARTWRCRPCTTTNVALTHEGLRRLGVAEAVRGALPVAFREPMRRRAPRELDDTGSSDPSTWDDGLGTGEAHLLVTVHAEDEAHGRGAAEALQERMDRHGVRTVHHQELHALPNRREHFGWADGFGQPAVEGYPPDDDEDDPRPEAGGRAPAKRPGQGVPLEDGSWRDLKAGEFILGHPDEDGQVLAGPATPLLRNGSFMVWRKLRQDVPLFRAGLQEEARRYGRTIGSPLGDDELYEVLAAKLVGRWRDGVAIEVVPERSGPDLRDLGDRAEREPDNDFVYTSDPDGFTCPRGAHIRRTNPRGVKGWGGTMATRHRIIRRGMPYGPPLEPGDEDEQERGLVFICFNADLERQFEIVQAQWCNDGNAFGLGNDKDYLLGDDQGTAKVTVEGTPPYFARAQPRIVLTRGCEYLLMPGINALRDLVEPRPGLVRR